MRALSVDLETVPCRTMGQELYGIDAADPDGYELIAAARIAEAENSGGFLKPFAHRIVAVGMVGMDLNTGRVAVVSDAGADEAELIRRVHVMLSGKPVLVTWNGLGFDLPVLRYRALHHSLPLPQLYGPIAQKAWDKYDYRFGDQHYDLCDLLSGFGRSTSLKLSEAAALCGLACKTECTGVGVLKLWREERYEEISAYVAEDAVATARVFLRWWASTGRARWDNLRVLDEKMADQLTTGAAA